MNDGVLFKNFVVGCRAKPIKECEMVLECNKGNYRLYVDKMPEGNNFYCQAVEFVSCSGDADNIWECESLTVDPLFNAIAYSDGVRHLEFNRENIQMAGYIYYPNMEGLIELMQKVREIELEVCKNCD